MQQRNVVCEFKTTGPQGLDSAEINLNGSSRLILLPCWEAEEKKKKVSKSHSHSKIGHFVQSN